MERVRDLLDTSGRPSQNLKVWKDHQRALNPVAFVVGDHHTR